VISTPVIPGAGAVRRADPRTSDCGDPPASPPTVLRGIARRSMPSMVAAMDSSSPSHAAASFWTLWTGRQRVENLCQVFQDTEVTFIATDQESSIGKAVWCHQLRATYGSVVPISSSWRDSGARSMSAPIDQFIRIYVRSKTELGFNL
jgi:hypothetical protein